MKHGSTRHNSHRKKRFTGVDSMAPLLGILFCVSGFLFLHEAFKHNTEGFAHEIFAAVMASVFTVSCMAMLLRAKSREERERVFHSHVFQSKLRIYERLLTLIFEMDDDGVITEEEIKTVENHAGSAALVGGEELICVVAQFMFQLKLYGRVYFRNMDDEQAEMFVKSLNSRTIGCDNVRESRLVAYLCPAKMALRSGNTPVIASDAGRFFVSLDDVVQAMREDLSIVAGNVHDVLEAFIDVPFDHHHLLRTPNLVK